MKSATTRKIRCAIYTRKSTEEGLSKDFNSLDAQREACEAYIVSQKALGWVPVGDRYEDGGYSGGNMERPALKRLLADIELRKINVVLVYKLDRISRSLMDFAKLVEVFESHAITFVSVTQAFNTTSSMGRLTLNMLLSFAQFEREVIGERTRDKIAASRRKGMWMGGNVPLGYDARDRKLIINKVEAAWVQTVFERFVQTGSVTRMLPALHAEGLRTKRGKLADKSYLYKLLNNRVYLGDAVHKGTPYAGEHKAIIDRKLWDRAHALLQERPRKRAAASRAQTPALLKGLLFGPTGITMTPTHTRRGGRLYRYYICSGMLRHGKDPAADRETASLRRIAAGEIERAVIDQIRVLLRAPEIVVQTWRAARPSAGRLTEAQVRDALHSFEPLWNELFPAEQARIVQLLVDRVDVTTGGIQIRLRTEGLATLVADLRGAAMDRAA
jgi:DNA invertase Pin-like site-specific DNA recombinase